jgi:hypothetical protein
MRLLTTSSLNLPKVVTVFQVNGFFSARYHVKYE